MRLASLVALLAGLTVLAACGPDPAPDAPEAGPLESPAPPSPTSGPSLTVAVDSLLRDEPDLNYRVAIGYPQIRGTSGEPMAPALQAVNAAIRDTVEALADDFRPEAPPPGADAPHYPVEVDGGTPRSWISDDAFSALVEVYAYTGGAHGNTYFLPLTFDLTTGEAVRPADLFAEGTPWADTLAAHTERGVLRWLGDRGALFAEGLDPIREGRVDLTLDPDSLVVHVPPYQLSAYAAGSFHVGVPLSAVAPFARPGSVLARLTDGPAVQATDPSTSRTLRGD
ncbi:DUF3298 and DUF4163 domain-containing protein [Rubrivirga marina]|nr:DUF3298 and DUF4163 domain-containing protein [Rubrivirga marina]